MSEWKRKRTAARYHQKDVRSRKVQRGAPKCLIVSTLPGGGRVTASCFEPAGLAGAVRAATALADALACGCATASALGAGDGWAVAGATSVGGEEGAVGSVVVAE